MTGQMAREKRPSELSPEASTATAISLVGPSTASIAFSPRRVGGPSHRPPGAIVPAALARLPRRRSTEARLVCPATTATNVWSPASAAPPDGAEPKLATRAGSAAPGTQVQTAPLAATITTLPLAQMRGVAAGSGRTVRARS